MTGAKNGNGNEMCDTNKQPRTEEKWLVAVENDSVNSKCTEYLHCNQSNVSFGMR